MQSVNLTCHTDCTELNLAGVLDVSQARAAYQSFNEALVRALPLRLHASSLERVDTAALQLLLAFQKTARERGLRIQWESTSAALQNSATALGLSEALGLHA